MRHHKSYGRGNEDGYSVRVHIRLKERYGIVKYSKQNLYEAEIEISRVLVSTYFRHLTHTMEGNGGQAARYLCILWLQWLPIWGFGESWKIVDGLVRQSANLSLSIDSFRSSQNRLAEI